MIDEAWRPVVGFETRYEVSNLGRMRNKSGHLLTPSPTGRTMHLVVTFWQDGKHHTRLVHQLVLEAFVGPRPSGHVGCHRDDRAGDNRLENLFWGTRLQNNAIHKGDGSHLSKFSSGDIDRVRDLHACGVTNRAIGKWLDMTYGNVAHIIRGRTWRGMVKHGY